MEAAPAEEVAEATEAQDEAPEAVSHEAPDAVAEASPKQTPENNTEETDR